MSTSSKLLYLQDTKSAIKDAIVAKGVSVPVGSTFRSYADKIADISGEGGGPVGPTAEPYVRPTEWLALPANVNDVQKVSILMAVFDTDSEYTAFMFQGAYTVDWGDGTSNSYASNIRAEHKYSYTNVSLNTDTVTKFGYKQCIITITPQIGNNISYVNLNIAHSIVNNSSSYPINTGFLDININGSYIATLYTMITPTYVLHSMLEQINIGELNSGMTTMSYQFYNCYSLKNIILGSWTSQITNWGNCFQNCYSLQKAPVITFRPAGVSNIISMYDSCRSLVEVAPMNVVLTANACSSVFSGCYRVDNVELNITSTVNQAFTTIFGSCYGLSNLILTLTGGGKVNSLASAFNTCYSLRVLPNLDTSLCTSFSSAFSTSGILRLPNYNYLAATTLASMCNGCSELEEVPDIVLSSSCTTLSSTFSSCLSLVKAPNITGGTNVTTANSMYIGCTSLTSIPNYVFPLCVSIVSFASSCTSLVCMPILTISASYTANSTILDSSFSLKRMQMPLKFSFSVANAKMSSTALNEMYTALPTVTGQTVTVTGNFGTTGDNPAIATAKGWTVTG